MRQTARLGWEIGTAENWSLIAFAVCAPPPAGLQLVKATSALDSDEFSTAAASCPAGKHLVGTGGDINGGFGEALVDDIRMDPNRTKTTVTAYEDQTGLF